MVFFKRLSRSRSRSNSNSYVDQYDPARHDSKTNSASYDDKYASSAPVGSPTDDELNRGLPIRSLSETRGGADHGLPKEPDMYSRRERPVEVGQQQFGAIPNTSNGNLNGGQYAPGRAPGSSGGLAGLSSGYPSGGNTFDHGKAEPAPDLLLQAFNQAIRPYSDKIDNLEGEIADLKAYIDALERQRTEVHAWIDKRGLRPDVPPSIAQIMDSSSHSTSPAHASATLNAQLDRKITIVNFDLHRLQDDLNDSLPTPSFSACMLKFLPDIARLSALPSGPRHAFDLLLKLGGNLNSHGGLENGDEEDIAERRSFYGRLDDAMTDVVKGRFREEGDGWGVQREIKRIEKTGAYLRNWGVEPYFPRTLDVMRDGVSGSAGGGLQTSAAAGAQSPGY
ncbi:hypothetical protein TI39_contig305g00035 [Zymoseptoria brevis]|uniref:Uncharacterized protein n=1 Tax=Zymoseptoria brevis TaxID=1047168 RepID=A0A0F4GUB6_9PEZI|nr:hypothetical protein TI39_contig305g00035 [Zymoseptoria brevis]